MTKGFRYLLGAALLAGPGLVAWAQVSVSPAPPPTSAPATMAVHATSVPTTMVGSMTLPSAQSVLESMLNDKPAPATPAASTNPALTPAMEAAAPDEPKTKRIREGQFIWNRSGRLVKDEKTGTYVFSFDADGKGMADPPMALLPSHLLASMEDASDKGVRAVKFEVSGEVTEYRGKNFLYVRYMKAIRDLNQGIGEK